MTMWIVPCSCVKYVHSYKKGNFIFPLCSQCVFRLRRLICTILYIVLNQLYRSCGTFLYRERLQQQNGDMRKRDRVETTCTWLHLVQGHICYPSPPPPLLTPPFKCDNRTAGLRSHFRPPSPAPPQEDYSQILAT